MEKKNKLIAEFMGCTHPFNDLTDATLYNVSHGTFELSDLRYDTSWDWLMPVVAKCTELNNDEFDNQSIAWALLSNSIIDVYDQVVEFIKEYNDGKDK
jgi:hypothetical protein